MAFALTATLDASRLAARLAATGIPAGTDTLTIERTGPTLASAGVRGAVDVPVTGTTHIARDYELPFNVPVNYDAIAYDGLTITEVASTTFEIDYDDCKIWLVDIGRPTNSLPVMVESLRELSFEVPAGVHRVLDRPDPILTTLPAWSPTGEAVVLTDTLAERDKLRRLLGTGYPMLARTLIEQGVGDHYGLSYFGVTSFIEERPLTLGTAAQRRFRVAVVRVDRPDPSIFVPLAPFTYEDVSDTYATYYLLHETVGTYDELAYTYPP